MWVDNRSKGVLGRSLRKKSGQRHFFVDATFSVGGQKVGNRSKMNIGSRANVISSSGDVKCSRAKGREKVLNGIGNVGKKSAHSQANVFFTSTGGR